jgi:hypothetical protein
VLSSFIPYLIGSVGLTVVLVLSHITWPIRYWGCRLLKACGLRLPCPLYCSMCSGVWIGGAVGAIKIVLSHGGWQVVQAEPAAFALDVLTMAFSTSFVAYLATTWLRAHGEYTEPCHDQEKYDAEGK